MTSSFYLEDNTMITKYAQESFLNTFRWIDLPRCIAGAISSTIPGTPQSTYSLLNKTLCFANGSVDSRGKECWSTVSKFLIQKPSSHMIVVPQLINAKSPDGKLTKNVSGWTAVTVYDQSQTYGDDLKYTLPPERRLEAMKLCHHFDIKASHVDKWYPIQTIFEQSEMELAGESIKRVIWQICCRIYREVYPQCKDQERRLLVEEITALSILNSINYNVHFTGSHTDRIRIYGQKHRLSSLAAIFTTIRAVERMWKYINDNFVSEA